MSDEHDHRVIRSESEGPGGEGGTKAGDASMATPLTRPEPVPRGVEGATLSPLRGARALELHRLIAALWLGSGFFLVLAASAAFRVAGDPFTAANFVGAMLARWHYIALFAPVLLLILEWRRQRNRIVLLLFIAIVVAALESLIDVRIAVMRQRSIVLISSLSRTNPVRRQFGMLHGLSTLLLLVDVVAAAAIVVLEPHNG